MVQAVYCLTFYALIHWLGKQKKISSEIKNVLVLAINTIKWYSKHLYYIALYHMN